MKRKEFVGIAFFFCSLECFCQVAQPTDTFNLLFHNSDSLCKTETYDVYQANPIVKKYRKFAAGNNDADSGRIKFYICKELFVYKPSLPVDTCSTLQINSIPFTNIKKLEEKLYQIAAYNARQTGEIKVVTKSDFNNVFLYERLNDQQFIKYRVDWIEWIE